MSIRTDTIGIRILATLLVCAAGAPLLAGQMDWPGPHGDGIVYEQLPFPSGGTPSDTAFAVFSPYDTQQTAEDVVLSSRATLRRIVWWGYYFLGEEPATQEQIRIRFYLPRLGDGLPDDQNILQEYIFVDPPRAWTGGFVSDIESPRELRFEVDLPSALDLDAGQVYWLEITQIGDISTEFLWEAAEGTGNSPYAIKGSLVPGGDWQLYNGDVSFQLSTIPEPGSGAVVLLGLGLGVGWGRRKEARDRR